MSSTLLCAVIFLATVLTFSAAQTSCKGRCGSEYYRGYMCQCDYSCLTYGECCKDYESQCTTKNSCQGRCGETFKRGRLCSCDSDCMKYQQCCPDHENHCDAEEEISGAASATAPKETSSCDNVNDSKHKESSQPIEQPSTFSEGNNPDDDVIPAVSPTSHPPDDLSNDKNSQIFPSDEIPNSGGKDLEASPVPEATSDYGSTVDLPDQASTESALEFSTKTLSHQTDMTPSSNEPTQANDSPSSLSMASGEGPTESMDANDLISSPTPGATSPQPTATVLHISSQHTPTSAPQTGPAPSASVPDLESSGQVVPEEDIFPEAQMTDLPEASSHKPEVTTAPVSTASAPAELTTQAATTPTSSTLDSIPNPEATPSVPEAKDPENAGEAATGPPSDPSTSVSAGPGGLMELSVPTTHTPSSTAAAAQGDSTDGVTPQGATDDPARVTTDWTKLQPDAGTTSKPQVEPAKPALSKPTLKPVTKPLDVAEPMKVDYQADDTSDTNLCSGRPVGAVATLRNGTTVVFRGHYFWFLDSNRVPGPARGITQVWGVPSPVDTVFTRCNCQGKTYIFKGPQYWRFENDVLDPGYPKVVETGFDGLRGHVTAALSVPQYRGRKESVYFFKRGGFVQKYSYQSGTSPTCGRKVKYAVYTVRNRMARQAGPAIDIGQSWRGFPSTITAAVSVPNNRAPEGYKYYVFSRTKSYNVRMEGERPVITAPDSTSPQNNVIKCPENV